MPGNADKNKSVLFIQSGEILNNPFLLARILNFRMGTKTYRGTKIISWTVSRIVDGKTVTETRMQTLSATLTKPYPLYSTESFILYANDAAGDLSFNSDPPDLSGLNDRQIENLISRKEREIEKRPGTRLRITASLLRLPIRNSKRCLTLWIAITRFNFACFSPRSRKRKS